MHLFECMVCICYNLLICRQGWRICYYGTGILALIFAILTGTTLKEPERKAIGEENHANPDAKKMTIWGVIAQPRIILLCIAASLRHCGNILLIFNYQNNIHSIMHR